MTVWLFVLFTTWFLAGVPSHAAAPAGVTQSSTGGGVTLKATLLNPTGNEDLRFNIVLDTHSVDLDAYDLKAVSVLRDDAGNTYEPIRVENKGGGHHRQVVLVFPRPKGNVKKLELVVKGIAGIEERSLRWDLSQ
jgi:hypothetical protein